MSGFGAKYRADTDSSLYTVEAHLRYLDEVPGGCVVEVRSSVIGTSAKLLCIWHEMWLDERLRATEEILAVHVTQGRSSALPAAVDSRVAALRTEPGEHAGRRIHLAP